MWRAKTGSLGWILFGGVCRLYYCFLRKQTVRFCAWRYHGDTILQIKSSDVSESVLRMFLRLVKILFRGPSSCVLRQNAPIFETRSVATRASTSSLPCSSGHVAEADLDIAHGYS